MKCGYKVQGEAIFDEIKKGEIPGCVACKQRIAEDMLKPHGMKRKRSSNGAQKPRKKSSSESSTEDEEYDVPTPGVMKVGYLILTPPLKCFY